MIMLEREDFETHILTDMMPIACIFLINS
jgi:hypothetical protein